MKKAQETDLILEKTKKRIAVVDEFDFENVKNFIEDMCNLI